MIGLCIKYYHENYGGMLQAYATTKIMEKRNLKYEIIRYKKRHTPLFIIKSLPRLFNRVLLNDKYELFQKKFSLLTNNKYKDNSKIRSQCFNSFKDDYFQNLSDVICGYDNLKNYSKKYSAVVTGSDQLWSPAGLPTNFYNLMFVDDEIKKISYASSFGVKKIPWYQKRRTRNFLLRFDHISVRENAGALIVKNLINKEVPVILDPVCMLTREEWKQIIPKEQIIKEKYAFVYFLGKNNEYRTKVQEYCTKNNLKIVVLKHLDQYIKSDENFGDYSLYNVGPKEFLNLLVNSEYVFTDSFHGSMFSIIFNKKFIVFNRYKNNSKHSKNSRIDSLCTNLGIENSRYYGDIESNINYSINYKDVNKRLNKLINAANLYLDEALNAEKENK